MSLQENGKVCELCNIDIAKYVCPRCGVPYCSLKCYKDEKKHLKCSESFYRDCVMNNLEVQAEEAKKDPAAAKKMEEALQRFHHQYGQDQDEQEEEEEEEVLDSDDDEPLINRLNGINLDDADKVWEMLTEEERNEFQKFIKSVNIETVVKEWEPWWWAKSAPLLVEEIDDDNAQVGEKSVKKQCSKLNANEPDILDNIPPMSTLTRVKPNDCVKWNLVNVIASFVWTSRLYNGEFLSEDNPLEVASSLITLSSFLSKDSVFVTFDQALTDVSLNACRVPELFDGGPTLQASLKQDVVQILTGPKNHPFGLKSYVLSALSQSYTLLSTVHKKQTSSSPETSFSKLFSSKSTPIDPKRLSKSKRKLHYLLAFANENDLV